MKNYYNLERTKLFSNWKYMISMFVLLFTFTVGYAQVTTNGGSGLNPTYTSLASAITALNAATITSPVVITLIANETAPVGGYIINATGTVVNPISIVGTVQILSAFVGTATPASATPDGIMRINGGDYITIDGLTFTDSNTTNPATMEYGVGLFKASVTNGASNNTIKNCVFNMQRVNNVSGTAPMVEGSVGILMINSLSTAATTSLTPTAASGSNSNNSFFTNTTNGGNYGIVLIGFAAALPYTLADVGNNIGGSSVATGNTILNFGGAAASTNPTAGIRTLNQYDFNASYNILNNNNGSGVNPVNTARGIFINAAPGAGVNVNNNTLTLASGATTSLLSAIEIASGSTPNSNTTNVNNNTIQNCQYKTATTGTFNGILVTGSPTTLNANGNAVTGTIVGLAATASSATLQGIYASGSAVNTNINSNNISNNTINNFGGVFYGIRGLTTLFTANNNNIFGNSIPLTGGALIGTLNGIFNLGSPTLETLTNNSIYNNSIGGASTSTSHEIRGINLNSTGSSVKNWSGNTIYGLSVSNTSATGSGQVFGISSSSGNIINIFKNKIYDLSAQGPSSTVTGISFGSGTTITAYNNLIGDLRAPASSFVDAVLGFNITGGTTANLYHNSIYLNASSSAAIFGTSGVRGIAGTNIRLNNNLVINKSTAAGATGFTVAYKRGGALTAGNYIAGSDNNIFYSGTPSASNLIFTDGVALNQTLADFKTLVGSGRDAASQTEDTSAFFQSTVGSNADYLRIPIGTTTFAESGAVLISLPSIIVDYWGITRPFPSPVNGGTSPDIGASEFDGIPNLPACIAPTNQATALVTGVTTASSTAGSFTTATSAPTGYLVVASPGVLSGTPVNGTVYAAGNTLGNGIVLQSSTALTYNGIGLIANTAYTITVFTYNSTACIGVKYQTTSPLTGTVTTCPAAPTVLVNSVITASSFTTSWTAPVGGSAGAIAYTVDVATDALFASPVVGSPFTAGSATTQVVSGLNSAVTYYIRIKANNGTCDSAFLTGTATTLCLPASFTTTDGTRCGTGSAVLTAVPSAGNVAWYAAATGGTSLFTGNTFNTPTISTTTQYYAESQIPGANVNIGPLSPAIGTFGTSFTGSYQIFDVTSPVTLNTVDVFATAAGNVIITLLNSAGTVLQTSATYAINAAQANSTTTVPGTIITVPVNFIIPPGTGYRLNYATASTATLTRNSVGASATYGPIGGVTITGNSNATVGFFYNFYNWSFQTTCSSSPRTVVTATVTAPPAITPSSAAAICNGATTALTVSSANAGYTYTWSPAAGLSATTGTSVNANPVTTTTYTVTANDAVSGCATTGTIVVTVNPAPTAVTVTPATVNVCPNGIQALAANGGSISGLATIGSDTTLTTATGEVTAFCNRRLNYRSQTIYTAAELASAVVVAGNITSIAYNVNSLGDAATNANFVVKIGTSATTAFATTTFVPTTSFTTVYGPATYTHTATGWQTITFVTPFVWDGVSNIVVEVSHDGIDSINNAQTYYSPTIDNKYLYQYNNVAATTIGVFTLNRLNTRFNYALTAPITWSPVAGLYTDATATTAYTGTALTTVYAKPTANQTYTATATLGTCTKTATSVLTLTTINNSVTLALGTFTAAQSGATYQWFTCPGNVTIAGETARTFSPTSSGDYGVTVSLSGCVATSVCTTYTNLSIDSVTNAGFKIYPNPTLDILNIEYTSDLSSVSVYNLLGQQVLNKKVTATTANIDMSGLNTGTYLVKVEANNASKTIKVFKK